MKAYCVRCKESQEIVNPINSESSGRQFIKGTCPKCGTKMCRAMGYKNHK